MLCDDETHAATADEIRVVPMRPTTLKGKVAPVIPLRPVASSDLLEMPKLSALPAGQYCESDESARVQARVAEWVYDPSTFCAVALTGNHGAGKTQALMQARLLVERHCRLIHVRCRSHEGAQRGALARRLFARLCCHDVWQSLQYIMPVLDVSGGEADASAPRLGADECLLEAEYRLLRAHASGRGATEGAASVGHAEAAARLSGVAPTDVGGSRAAERRQSVASGPTEPHPSGSLCLVLDDVQHMDAHSIKLVRLLLERRPAHMLLLIAQRNDDWRVDHDTDAEPGAEQSAPTPDEVGDHDGCEAVSLGEASFTRAARRADCTPGGGGGEALVAAVAAEEDFLSLELRPLGVSACKRFAGMVLDVDDVPKEVVELLMQRGAGSPQLCQAILSMLVSRRLLIIREDERKCYLACLASARSLHNTASVAIVEKRRCVLSVRLAQLSMLQQLLLKSMSMLREPICASTLAQALPATVPMGRLRAELDALCERHYIQAHAPASAHAHMSPRASRVGAGACADGAGDGRMRQGRPDVLDDRSRHARGARRDVRLARIARAHACAPRRCAST